MFRVVRLVVFCLVAFVAGVFYERANQKDLCTSIDGEWLRAGYCVGDTHDV